MCVTDPDKGNEGISAIFIDLDSPGVTLDTACVPITGQYVDADIILDNVRVPRCNCIGGEGNGFRLAMNRISLNRLLHCPTMIGLARQALRLSIDYANTRRQFGGPIMRFQAIQHMLADIASSLFACESMVLAAARRADAGSDVRMEASMQALRLGSLLPDRGQAGRFMATWVSRRTIRSSSSSAGSGYTASSREPAKSSVTRSPRKSCRGMGLECARAILIATSTPASSGSTGCSPRTASAATSGCMSTYRAVIPPEMHRAAGCRNCEATRVARQSCESLASWLDLSSAF
jgi:hypothetical protein